MRIRHRCLEKAFPIIPDGGSVEDVLLEKK